MMLWYTARGAGLAALVLLSISTSIGALVSRGGRTSTQVNRRYVVQYLHRAGAGLGLLVLGVHVGTILADPYAGVGWHGAIVPFASGYRPGWGALGTIAVYLFLTAAVLGLARGRMAASPHGARVWRALHCLAYVGWFSAMWHGFFSGTDSETGWVRLLYLACLVMVFAAGAARLASVRLGRPGPGGRFVATPPARPLPEAAR
jgi:hypothetical protein